MKKRVLMIIILIIVLTIGLFVLTGCSNENNSLQKNNEEVKDNTIVTIGEESFKLKSETELNNLHYLENYVDFHTDRVGNTKIMSYTKNGDLAFEVRVNYDENRSDSEAKAIVETQFKTTEKSKEVNGIKYIYYEYIVDTGENVHHYIYVFNGKVYSIGFFLGKNPGNIEEVFMNNVKFQ